jgi:ribose transport system permease protein
MPSFIVTLAFWQIYRGLSYQFAKGGQTIFGMPSALAFFGQGYIFGIPVAVLIFSAIGLAGYIILHHTTYGRKLYAVGGNATTAWLSGISTVNVTFSVYLISGLCAAIAAVITLSRLMCASVQMTNGLELDAIAAVVIGGISLMGGEGLIVGVLLGAVIIGVINNGLNLMGVDPYIQEVAKGFIIFLAVAADVIRKRQD